MHASYPSPRLKYGQLRALLCKAAFAAAVFCAASQVQIFAQTAPEKAAQTASSTMAATAPEKGKDSGAQAARAKLLADTHMLLVLSRQLKVETAKTAPNTLSLAMVKKSEEIQRLAAIVRVEMAKTQ